MNEDKYGEMNLCGACKKLRECRYCSICKTFLCEACKNNPPKRFVAMVKRILNHD